MKRLNNLYQKICSLENLKLADKLARKGKGAQSCILQHDLNADANILQLHQSLVDKSYRTSGYSTFKIYEPKERIIYRVKSYADRIVQHAIMNVLEPLFVAAFTTDSYSCIKGKGIHAAARNLRYALRDIDNTAYCLKLDIKKFYPNIDHHVLKMLLQRKFKDNDLLWLFNEIIDSAAGLPIGNYLSQYLANFYLTGFDHWLKEHKQVKYYFRYADDVVILSSDKAALHELFTEIGQYLSTKLHLTIKSNYQVFPVDVRGIDFVGYVFKHSHTRLRKTIKKNFARMVKVRNNAASLASYNGWIKHCNGRHLHKTILAQAV